MNIDDLEPNYLVWHYPDSAPAYAQPGGILRREPAPGWYVTTAVGCSRDMSGPFATEQEARDEGDKWLNDRRGEDAEAEKGQS